MSTPWVDMGLLPIGAALLVYGWKNRTHPMKGAAFYAGCGFTFSSLSMLLIWCLS